MSYLEVILLIVVVVVLCRVLFIRQASKKVNSFLKNKRLDDSQELGSTNLNLDMDDQIELLKLFRGKKK